eukprot:COSAG05_NODE_20042_length_284_cov_0.421622_1_plen_27_part_10
MHVPLLRQSLRRLSSEVAGVQSVSSPP